MIELALGTAQFGLAYGALNALGRLSDDQVGEIVRYAADNGVTLLDTSSEYGDAQSRLGAIAPAGTRFVSKFRLPEAGSPVDRHGLIGRTLGELGVDRVHGMMFHRVEDLRDPRAAEAWSVLREARDAGLVARLGASVYELADLEAAADVLPGLDLLQVPGSIADRRLLDSPLLRRLHDGGVEIHVRSAYLQGVLFSDPDGLPAHLAGLAPFLAELRDAASRAGTTVLASALHFLRDHPVADVVVIGTTSVSELEGTVAAWRDPIAAPEIGAPDIADAVLDPRTWPPRGPS